MKNIFNLKPGIYNVKISDSNNCIAEENFEIKSPEVFEFNSVNTISPTCFNGSDGKINLSLREVMELHIKSIGQRKLMEYMYLLMMKIQMIIC